jgi:hypothetical protein
LPRHVARHPPVTLVAAYFYNYRCPNLSTTTTRTRTTRTRTTRTNTHTDKLPHPHTTGAHSYIAESTRARKMANLTQDNEIDTTSSAAQSSIVEMVEDPTPNDSELNPLSVSSQTQHAPDYMR